MSLGHYVIFRHTSTPTMTYITPHPESNEDNVVLVETMTRLPWSFVTDRINGLTTIGPANDNRTLIIQQVLPHQTGFVLSDTMDVQRTWLSVVNNHRLTGSSGAVRDVAVEERMYYSDEVIAISI